MFRTNIFGYFFMTQAALPPMLEGGAIVNTTSMTPIAGASSGSITDHTKGAIVAFTRALAQSLVERKILRQRRGARPE